MNIEEYVKTHAILDSDDKVVVKELWSGRYRVNVWKHDPSNRISQSFFIKVEEDKIYCNPTMGA